MNTILVATDFSDVARQAYYPAASLAKSHGAKIELAHEVEALPPVFHENVLESIQTEKYHGRLDELLKSEVDHEAFAGVTPTPHLLFRGTPRGNVVDYARDMGIDLIVLATHGRTGLSHSLLGSFTEHVTRHSGVPVLTSRHDATGDPSFDPKRVLVPFDFSENSKAVLPLLRTLFTGSDAEVRLVHVLPEVSVRGDWGDAQQRLKATEEAAAKMEEEVLNLASRELPNVNVVVDTRYGDAYHEIMREVRVVDHDLVVMATHGWTGIERLYFGSVTEKMLRTCPCSVLTVRPDRIVPDPHHAEA